MKFKKCLEIENDVLQNMADRIDSEILAKIYKISKVEAARELGILEIPALVKITHTSQIKMKGG